MADTNLIEILIASAERALSVPQEDVEQVMASLDRYLEDFEHWQQSLGSANPLGADSKLSLEAKRLLRNKLETLAVLHQRVVERADANRQSVHDQISEIRKRTQALKAYIDRYPSRITIAGKREG